MTTSLHKKEISYRKQAPLNSSAGSFTALMRIIDHPQVICSMQDTRGFFIQGLPIKKNDSAMYFSVPELEEIHSNLPLLLSYAQRVTPRTIGRSLKDWVEYQLLPGHMYKKSNTRISEIKKVVAYHVSEQHHTGLELQVQYEETAQHKETAVNIVKTYCATQLLGNKQLDRYYPGFANRLAVAQGMQMGGKQLTDYVFPRDNVFMLTDEKRSDKENSGTENSLSFILE